MLRQLAPGWISSAAAPAKSVVFSDACLMLLHGQASTRRATRVHGRCTCWRSTRRWRRAWRPSWTLRSCWSLRSARTRGSCSGPTSRASPTCRPSSRRAQTWSGMLAVYLTFTVESTFASTCKSRCLHRRCCGCTCWWAWARGSRILNFESALSSAVRRTGHVVHASAGARGPLAQIP